MRNTSKYCVLLSFLIIFLSHQTFPQSNIQSKIHFKHITRNDGLSDSFIRCIIQDNKGFIWVGTQDGLDRYDGIKIKVFKYSPEDINSLGANAIRVLYQDKSGIIWVGTAGGGLNKFDSELENFTRYTNDPVNSKTISSNVITSIYEDRSGTLWVGTQDRGLNSLDRETNQFNRYEYIPDDPSSLSENHIFTMFEDFKGNLWIGTVGGGLNRFDKLNKKFIRYIHDPVDPGSLSDNKVTGICEDNNGNLWVSTLGGGINKLTFTHDRYVSGFIHYEHNPNVSNSLSNNDIYTLFIDRDNEIWLGTWGGGLINTNPGNTDFSSPVFSCFQHDLNDPFSLDNNNVTSIYENNSGLLWIGTWGGGVHIYDKQRKAFRLFEHNSNDPFSLSAKGVTTIYEDKLGILWVGTWDGGLNKLDRRTNRFKHYEHDPDDKYTISDNAISAICEDSKGFLWIGTQLGGLNKFDRDKEKFYRYERDPQNPNSINDNYTFSIFVDSTGIIWVGTSRGLNKFNTETETFMHQGNSTDNLINNLKDQVVFTIYRDKEGIIWIGTRGGLYSYNQENEKFLHYSFNYDKQVGSSPLNVISIYEDKTGILWVGTIERGLIRLNRENGQFKNYMMKDGLPSDYILGILEDDNRYLWLSTNYGLSKFDPVKETFRNYDVDDGLQGNEFEQFSSCCKIRTGELIFGGTKGFNIFYPDSIRDNSHIPPVLITDFYLFNKPVPIGYDSTNGRTILSKSVTISEEINLKYDDKVFSLEFASLDFHAPQKNKYAYILEGFDNNWTYTDANRRSATYTNLDPGEYVFRVRGSNNDGVWNEAGTSIKIIILPPWWATQWAYAIYVFILICIIYFTWKLQLKRLRVKHDLEMSKFEAEKLHEVDELKTRFFTNISHEFRTPLTLILGPVKQAIEKIKDEKTKDELGIAHKNANKLLGLVNQLLDISKLESGNMKLRAIATDFIPLLKAFTLSLASYAERKRIMLNFNSTEDEIIVYIDKDKIEKILTNILSNAFKFTPEGGRIEVTLNKDDKYLNIIISDTGIGITKEKIPKIFDRFYQVDGSHTREREGTGIGLSLTKELVEIHKGKIEVESEPGKGSTFIISLPLGKEHLKPEEISVLDQDSDYSIERITYDDETDIKTQEDTNPFVPDKDSLPLLLIIEDNSDARSYIGENLKADYRIIEAVDGEDGWHKSIKQLPDLIVSDVMMPKLDGFRLCEKLKSDERTSHIPVILLTAKAAKEDKLAGFETGADEYLMKPFDIDELKSRIKNFIDQRKRLQEHFRRQGLIGIDQQKITSVDKKFLQKSMDIISNHISDSSFSVEMLAEELAISRSGLHKKVQSLTGETPGDLIRRTRLNIAAKLIKNKFGNLSEIGLEVGYNNPAHFSEAFKRQYGITPSQFQKNNSS